MKFPCFFGLRKSIIKVRNKKEANPFFKGFSKSGLHLFHNGNSPDLKVLFIIDRNGGFRSVDIKKQHLLWTRNISWLHDFVIDECRVSDAEFLNAKDLRTRILNYVSDPDPHFPTTKLFLAFIDKMPNDHVFDKEQFDSFWNSNWGNSTPSDW